MTIRLPSLSKIGFSLLLLSSATFAADSLCSHDAEVLVRNNKDKYVFETRTLEDLNCDGSFEGKHFKIVNGVSDEPIRFDEANEILRRKAANVYYHLTIARNHWLNKIKSDYVRSLSQITIRLDITNAFSSVRHFKNAEQEKNFNNAWTIPSGETPSFAKEKKSWGKEIWFSPAKKLESMDLLNSDGNNPVFQSLELVKDPVIQYNQNSVIYQGMALLASPSINSSIVLNSSLKSLGAIAMLYGLIETSKKADRFFVSKYYFIETALVPEIIYHEYAHIAMSDTMATVHSVPVIEGMADYFAATIAKSETMYQSIKKYSSNKGKNLESKEKYHPFLEGQWNSTSDFTVSLLWQGRLAFEDYNRERAQKGQPEVANYDDLVFSAHQHLDENSDIMNNLTRSLTQACGEKCENKRIGINLLNGAWEKKGLN